MANGTDKSDALIADNQKLMGALEAEGPQKYDAALAAPTSNEADLARQNTTLSTQLQDMTADRDRLQQTLARTNTGLSEFLKRLGITVAVVLLTVGATLGTLYMTGFSAVQGVMT